MENHIQGMAPEGVNAPAQYCISLLKANASTLEGAEIYARIEGFISTARKHNRNVFSELCTTFDGNNFITG